MKKGYSIALVVIVLGIGGYFAYQQWWSAQEGDEVSLVDELDTTTTTDDEDLTLDDLMTDFGDATYVPHYVSNTPNHADSLAAVPVNVVIDVDFDLAAPSSISIKNGDTEYGTGETTVDASKLAMRRTMDPAAPDGVYTIAYKACWPDASCHNGTFRFEIDRTLAEYYEDERDKDSVAITMSDLTFDPIEIRVSKGTTVTWTNEEDETHYVNVDPHPGHTYFPAFNSRALAKGGTYSFTFEQAGYYPYHCSQHPDDMVGTIVVE